MIKLNLQLIKQLREKNKMTQAQLAKLVNVSDKTISKWETEKGYPDITLLEPLAKHNHLAANGIHLEAHIRFQTHQLF